LLPSSPSDEARPRVVYWFESATPATVHRCNAVAQRPEIDFEVWLNQRRGSHRSWDLDRLEWRFKVRYVRARSLLGQHFQVPVDELREFRPDLFVHDYDRAHLAVGFIAARAFAGRTAFRVLPNFDTIAHRTWWRELAKHFIFRSVDGAKVSGPEGRALASRYGLPARRAHTVTQSIDIGQFARARDVPEAEIKALRATFGLSGCVFLYVGRLWKHKGLDYLLDAYEQVRAECDCSLLLVGDGRDEEHYRRRAAALSGVSLPGFVQEDDLFRFYAVSDVSIFPTLGDAHGLVVEESLAAGLPVVSSESVGNIRYRLQDGKTGFIVPAADAEALATRMRELATEPALRARLARNTAQAVQDLGHERYAADFVRFVTSVMGTATRTTRGARLAAAMGRAMAPWLTVTAPRREAGRE
jgi:glycosyltransferase involved in cell wall biosynthesis